MKRSTWSTYSSQHAKVFYFDNVTVGFQGDNSHSLHSRHSFRGKASAKFSSSETQVILSYCGCLAVVLHPPWLPHRSSKCHHFDAVLRPCVRTAYVLIRMPERKMLLPQAKRQNINVFSAYWSIIYCSMDLCFWHLPMPMHTMRMIVAVVCGFRQSQPFAYCPAAFQGVRSTAGQTR